jgi:hypothetical protein
MGNRFNRTRAQRSRGAIALLVAAATMVGLVVGGSSSAWANHDPHRQYLPASPFDIPSNVCGFSVHVDIPVDRQYGTFSTNENGDTVLKITGSLVWTLTNTTNGNSVTLNASGPGTIVFPAETTLAIIDAQGLNIIYITNGADFGVPNIFYSSGLLEFTTDLSNDTIVSMPRRPHILQDVCAELA